MGPKSVVLCEFKVLWTDRPCKNFHLLICLAILDGEKSTLMENKFGITEILKVRQLYSKYIMSVVYFQ